MIQRTSDSAISFVRGPTSARMVSYASAAGRSRTRAIRTVAGLTASGPINPIAFTVMQERVPPEKRGRVFGAILGGVIIAAPIGMLVMGEITARWSPGVSLALAGLGFVAVGLVIVVRREFRELERA